MSIHEHTPVSVFTREAIWGQDYNLSLFAKDFEDRFTEALQTSLGLTSKPRRYEILRLFLGRSIYESSKDFNQDKNKVLFKERPIKGEFLFGNEDISTWASIIVIDGQLTHHAAMSDFKNRVEMHLDRGARLINNDLEEHSMGVITWLKLYSRRLSTKSSVMTIHSSKNEVVLRLGEVSQLFPSKKSVEFSLNRVGKPPHIALMGATSKGKTTTGIQMAKQIVDQSSIPILLIDPKGEFVQNGKLSSSIAKWNNASITPIQAGEIPIPLDFLPNSGIGDTGIQNAAMRFRDSLAMCCRSVGDLQRNRIHQVIENIMRDDSDRSLDSIKDAYLQELNRESLDKDSVYARLNELTLLNIFKPAMSSSDFFSKSWVISLASVDSEELKN
jgi:DNA sulfur modification protein DndE